MNILLFALLVSIGINLLMFVPAFIFKTDKITDISYAVTFATVAIASYIKSSQSFLHTVVLVLVLLWSARLGSFLFIRINKMKHDKRFDGMREKFFLFLRFWLLQGATVFVVMLAPVLAFRNSVTTFNIASIFGVVIFLVGLCIEAVVDQQKFKFSNQPKNNGKWIDEGIWKISRHPNYLGEMMVWIGMYVVVVSSLGGLGTFLAILSPAYIVLLLLFVSGVPLLEKAADQRWGTDPIYKDYKKHVPAVVPSVISLQRLF